MFSFDTSYKQQNLWFFGVSRGYQMGTLARNVFFALQIILNYDFGKQVTGSVIYTSVELDAHGEVFDIFFTINIGSRAQVHH